MKVGNTYSLTDTEPVAYRTGVASIAQNSCYLAGSRLLNYAVRFIYVIALARYLGPKFYGLYSYGMSWYLAFLPLTELGLGVILSKEVGRDRTQGARVVAQTLTLRTLVAIVAAGSCAIAGWFCEGEPEARRLILVFFYIGFLCIFGALIPSVRFLIYYFMGQGSGHI